MKLSYFFHKRLLVTVAFSAFVLMTSCSSSEDREKKYLKHAEEYFHEANYKKAKVEIKNVLQINPKNASARVLLGKLNQKEEDYRGAFQNFRAALEEDNKQVDARLELAKIYLSANKDSEAKQYVDEALALDPNAIEAKALSAGLFMRAGDKESALRLVNEVMAIDPKNFQAMAVFTGIHIETEPQLALDKLNAGLTLDGKSEALKRLKIEVLKRLGKLDDINTVYLELINEHPDIFKNYDRLASNYLEQNRLDDAEKTVRLAITNNPDKVDPIIALVQLTRKLRSAEQSELLLKEFIEKKPDLYTLKQALVEQYVRDNRVDDAKKLLSLVIEKNGKSAVGISARVDLIKILLATNDTTKANSLLDEVFAIEPSNAEARILSAKVKLSQNLIKDAISDLRAAIKSDAKSLVAYKLLAFAQEKDGSPELALDSYFKALEINNEDIASLFGAAHLSVESKNEETARKLLDRILKLNPTNLEAISLLTNLMVNKQEWDNVEKLCSPLIQSDVPTNKATGYTLLGKIFSAQQKWERAREQYEMALKIAPTSFDPMAGIVNTLLAENQVAKAATELDAYVKKYPEMKQAKRILADIYYKQKNTQAAIDIYNELIKDLPKEDTLYRNLASIYVEKNDIAKAESLYMDGLKANPDSVALHVYLGNFYSQIKKYDNAKTHYEFANQKLPNSDMVKNNLAILLVNQLQTPENIQKAMTLVSGFSNSKDANYIDTLGWVHYVSGNLPQAISFLQQAVTLKESTEFRYHLGMAYKKNGQAMEAKRELSLAVKEKNAAQDWLEPAKKALAEL